VDDELVLLVPETEELEVDVFVEGFETETTDELAEVPKFGCADVPLIVDI
jgi:hypothetical protein